MSEQRAEYHAMTLADRWRNLAAEWTPNSDYTLQDEAPAGVSCRTCWDLRICCECLNEYPEQCPLCNGAGHCVDCATPKASE